MELGGLANSAVIQWVHEYAPRVGRVAAGVGVHNKWLKTGCI